MTTTVISSVELDGGYLIEQLEDERGQTFYRVCHGGLCRYAEDHYMVMMYAEHMGASIKATRHASNGI